MYKHVKPEIKIKLVAVPRPQPDRERLVRALVEVLRLRMTGVTDQRHDGPHEEVPEGAPDREDPHE